MVLFSGLSIAPLLRHMQFHEGVEENAIEIDKKML
jgi:hypothetical protein